MSVSESSSYMLPSCKQKSRTSTAARGIHVSVKAQSRLGNTMLILYATDTSAKTITSQSKPTSFPSKLRDKLSGDIQAVDESAKDNEQLANESCEKCGGNEVRFHTVQLRSADEGSTVFYTCHSCGHKYAILRTWICEVEDEANTCYYRWNTNN